MSVCCIRCLKLVWHANVGKRDRSIVFFRMDTPQLYIQIRTGACRHCCKLTAKSWQQVYEDIFRETAKMWRWLLKEPNVCGLDDRMNIINCICCVKAPNEIEKLNWVAVCACATGHSCEHIVDFLFTDGIPAQYQLLYELIVFKPASLKLRKYYHYSFCSYSRERNLARFGAGSMKTLKTESSIKMRGNKGTNYAGFRLATRERNATSCKWDKVK